MTGHCTHCNEAIHLTNYTVGDITLWATTAKVENLELGNPFYCTDESKIHEPR